MCVCTFTIDTLHEYGQVEFTLTCLLTKVVSENPRLKLWENFYDKVMKTAFFNFEQRYCIIRTVLLVDAFTSTCIF